MTSTFKLGIGLAGTVLMAVVAGCGVQSTSTHASAAPTAYKITVDESLPSAPQPITVTWHGTLKKGATAFTHLSEQIGKTSAMTVVPMPTPKAPPSTLTPPTKSKSPTTTKTSATKTKATVNQSTTVHPVVNPTAAVPGLLTQEIGALAGTHPTLPLSLMPLVDAPLATPITVASRADIAKTWHDTVTLGSTVVPATVSLNASVAKPQGVLREMSWTLVMTTQSIQVKPKKGKPYFIPSLTWTERGTVTPVGS